MFSFSFQTRWFLPQQSSKKAFCKWSIWTYIFLCLIRHFQVKLNYQAGKIFKLRPTPHFPLSDQFSVQVGQTYFLLFKFNLTLSKKLNRFTRLKCWIRLRTPNVISPFQFWPMCFLLLLLVPLTLFSWPGGVFIFCLYFSDMGFPSAEAWILEAGPAALFFRLVPATNKKK